MVLFRTTLNKMTVNENHLKALTRMTFFTWTFSRTTCNVYVLF